ncbi:related to UPF0047 domain protein [Ustilago trichophora]|uniref:Related to UPF0047 domain protein n=1 Tax=Ustilago trichophora TaxID=86804 RepID=A0A5C3DX93_9BASI|nr:related to UPF0047 domain protein [Ustilago trichophora]
MSATPPSTTKDTLYSQSPHAPIDKREARRKLKAQHRAGHYSDPTYVTLIVLVLALLYWVLPIPGIFETLYGRKAHSKSAQCGCKSEIKLDPTMPWQKQFTLSSRSKGCHLVTNEVMPHIEEGLKGVKVGMLTLFIQHTSAALSLNENFDRDVRTDMDMALDKVVPESLPWKHTDEGPDDSVSHTKASLIGPSITIPITDGRLNVGTWQGVYLCEFRKLAHKRKIVATILP